MEFRRLGDSLLRSKASPLLSFLAPSVPPCWWTASTARQSQVLKTISPTSLRSTFHSTARQSTEQSRPHDADLDFLDDLTQSDLQPPARSSFSERIGRNSAIDSLLSSTMGDLSNVDKKKPSNPLLQTSATMVKDARRESSIRDRGRQQPGEYYRKMNMPAPANSKDLSNRSTSVDRMLHPGATKEPRAKRTVRSRPSIGRTVEVDVTRGVDFGRALKHLDIACAQNRVKQDLAQQRFHERPGMKRKRLKSERWRKLFRDSFRATVGRVKVMRRKGW